MTDAAAPADQLSAASGQHDRNGHVTRTAGQHPSSRISLTSTARMAG
jgi:hypothetical protein